MSREAEWARDKERFVAAAGRDEPAPPGPGPLAAEFASLTAALLTAGSVAAVLERIVVAAKNIVPGADMVSVTLRSPDGAFHTPVETDAVATKLDHLQYQYGEGACVEAARPSGPGVAISTDLADDARWPLFGPAAAELGYRSLVSTALVTDPATPDETGALNVYKREPGGLPEWDRNILLLLATHATLALSNTRAVTRAQLLQESFERAMDSRDVIGQAKGILMARQGISADAAFDVLRRTSQDLNVKLRDIASTVIARRDELGGRRS